MSAPRLGASILAPRASGPVSGLLEPPGSKSLTQRWLMLAALAEGTSVIENALRADDVEALTAGLRTLGAKVHWSGPNELEVQGVAGRFPGGGRLDAREGGTPARFLMAAASLAARPCTLDGSPRLRRRPMADGEALLAALGCTSRRMGEEGLPLEITPPGGGSMASEVSIARPASSQFVSAMALMAPWLPRGLRLHCQGGSPSDAYVHLTVQCLNRLGAEATWDGGKGELRVKPSPLGAFRVRVEPDASSAAYAWALAAIVPSSRIAVRGLSPASLQPDMGVWHALQRMGAKGFEEDGAAGIAHGGPKGCVELDASGWPDGSMAVMAAAAAGGEVTLRGLGTLAGKESDRITAMHAWLDAAGVNVERGQDWIRVHGPAAHADPVRVETHRDHRIAMSAAVLGAVRGGIEVLDPGCVSKSWPDFWTVWGQLLGQPA
ncbi:MAG: 3-phosphoshikimate 1-carboxyvinyltransferase [Planctomycetes bacterium]|nr:3-phosphoshikimate 1-carboxyvinyltransferase [Planctomycetota bacterium]